MRGESYLESLPIADRRENGQVYTPDHLVEFILRLSGYNSQHDIESETLLDPACGAGAFLQMAVEVLASRLKSKGSSLSGAQRSKFLSLIERNFFGVDIDKQACCLAREAVRSEVLRQSPGTLPDGFFSRNILSKDFLIDCSRRDLPPLEAGGFDLIVGNPPYVPATRLPDEYKDAVRKLYVTASGRLDLYTLFMERSITFLKPGGRLAMVTPDKFLTSETSKQLRRFILSFGSVRVVARFYSHKVFRDAATVPCVTVIERGSAKTEVSVLSCGEKPNSHGKVAIVGTSRIPHSQLGSDAWQLKSPTLLALARKLQSGHVQLSELTSRISAGPATGLDEVYVLPRDSESAVERELLHPVVRGRDVTANGIKDSGLNILLPYRFLKDGPVLIQLSDFPKAKKYLESHRTALEARHCVRVWEKAWYDLHDQPSCNLSKREKIIVPDIAESNRFAVDTGRYFPLHSTYYILPESDVDSNFLVGILNSSVAEFLMRLLAPTVKDGFSRYRKQFLAQLPIPKASASELKSISRAVKSRHFEEAKQLIARLFGLSKKENDAITQFLDGAALGESA